MNILHCSLLKQYFRINNLKNNKMDLMGMMGKLKETQNKIEETTIRYCSCWWTKYDGFIKSNS
jgi:hypothetical protein